MTCLIDLPVLLIEYFNSHPHEEDDLHLTIYRLNLVIFQLTSSRRGWLLILKFNLEICPISTHILTKRMTRHTRRTDPEQNISTHILTKRMTRSPSLSIGSCLYFNSHPHEEDDLKKGIKNKPFLFQLTSSRRGWRKLALMNIHWLIFQLTSSRRGWRIQRLASWTSTTFQLTSSRRGWQQTQQSE